MYEETIENENSFDDIPSVRKSALIEAKKKTGEAKSFLHKLASEGKKAINKSLNPEDLTRKLHSGISNKVKSALMSGKGPRAKSKR